MIDRGEILAVASHLGLSPRIVEKDYVLSILGIGLIEAPAGYGKTWLLARRYAEIRAAGSRVVWLGIEEADPAQFLSMIAAARASGNAIRHCGNPAD